MKTEKYIIASAVIAGNAVYKNGQCIYQNPVRDLTLFLHAVYEHFDMAYPKFYKMDLPAKLGWLASEILLKDEPLHHQWQPQDIALVMANSNSSLDTDFKYYDTVKDIASPALFVYTLPNIVTGEICIRNGWKGENAFFIFDQFDAGFTERYVNDLVDNDRAKACLCGWVDAMDGNYKTALFLVAKQTAGYSRLFTKENMETFFYPTNHTDAG